MQELFIILYNFCISYRTSQVKQALKGAMEIAEPQLTRTESESENRNAPERGASFFCGLCVQLKKRQANRPASDQHR